MSGTRLLLIVLGFWVVMRAINNDATGRTLVDKLIGNQASKSPLLATPTSSGSGSGVLGAVASGVAGTGSVLKSLFPSGTSIMLKRRDQGRDLQVPGGTTILAAGSGFLVRNGSDPNGFGDSYPIVHFTSGPWAGEDIYFGHTKSLLSGSQRFAAGQPISQTQFGKGPFVGNATGLAGWAEIGLAPGGNPGSMGQPLPAGL